MIHRLLALVEKFGGPEEINRQAATARQLDNLMGRLTSGKSPHVADLEWLTAQREKQAFISVQDYRRKILGSKGESTAFYEQQMAHKGRCQSTQFSTHADNLLRESAFCLIPAAPVFNYLDVTPSKDASMTVDRMGQWSVIVEGANTYSPDPNRKAMRIRMEQEVYRRRGVMIANDYLVNSGGVIFAAQEHLVPTP